jgi:hypothetical protein
MENTNDEQAKHGSGTEFTKRQQAIDQAKNEKIKAEKGSGDLTSDEANRNADRSLKTDVSAKKSGGGKQISPGT